MSDKTINDKTVGDSGKTDQGRASDGRMGEERAGGDAAGNSTMTWVVRPDPDLEDLIPSFLGNRRNDLVEIRGAVARSDYEFIRRTAHTLKGICRPYGFGHLEMLAKELEVAGQAEDAAGISRVAAEMQAYLDNVRVVYDN